MYKETYYKELVHVIWGLRCLRIWRADGFKFQSKSKSKGRRRQLSQLED